RSTCGKGSFILAVLGGFSSILKVIGVDINNDYLKITQNKLKLAKERNFVQLVNGDFFSTNWKDMIKALPKPILIIGNPPWVTNTVLGTLKSSNLPNKSNFQKYSGFEAITGKSNFDISEWMLIQMVDWLKDYDATVAMLCKTTVARKILLYAWKNEIKLERTKIFLIDAAKYFNAGVDACLFTASSANEYHDFDCEVFNNLHDEYPSSKFGYRNGFMVSNIEIYEKYRHLEGEERYKWRSGIKHDCAKVMELRGENGRYRNGFGETNELEDTFLYPMLKSSDVAKDRQLKPPRWMLVTQRSVGERTHIIEKMAPKTWKYLNQYGDLLDKRSSRIYKDKPRFSIFGVGNYTFSMYKVAISGFYKDLTFKAIKPFCGKPVVLDDTCYFISCFQGSTECHYLQSLLNSQPVKDYLSSMIFWDSKRPITLEILKRIDLLAVARECNSEYLLERYIEIRNQKKYQISLLFGS
ncbi:SAM-dependent DNA methyltransferase, partial [bacterium]|nr:SAM-dependent DNA methyltransferase [bacterium]